MRKIALVFSILIGGIMVSITSNNLGEQGNQIIHLI